VYTFQSELNTNLLLLLLVWHAPLGCIALNAADRCGCPVVRLTSSFHTWWYHLIPNNFRKHRYSRASFLSTSLLLSAQHPEPYRKIGRMQVLYNCSLLIFKSSDLNPVNYCVWVRYWDTTHAKTNQHCRAEDGLAIDMEWFAKEVHW